MTLAVAAADCGFEVFGIEINPVIKSCLKENRAHFFETGMDELICRYNNKRFNCVDKFPVDTKFDAFIITVGTPLQNGSKNPNFGAISAAIKSISQVYDGSQLVILRSTVSVGTTRNVIIPLLTKMCGKSEVFVSMCPEGTIEGKAIEELKNLPQVISGNNVRALKMAEKIFSQITNQIIKADSLEEAELIKLYCNTYRDMNFSIGNAFCLAAQTFGVDGMNVIKRANKGYKRSAIALPGFVAGPCLEKDAYILTNNMADCISRKFILNARNVNESLEDEVVEWINKNIGGLSTDKFITLSGMAFKGRPETSDLRGSSAVNIACKLNRLGYKLKLHDFVADIDEMTALGFGKAYDDLNNACENSVALLVLNNHKCYSEIEEIDNLSNDSIILDTWNVCDKLYKRYSKIYTLGNIKLGGVAN
ncbi:MAG: nucleotide sugar dehydrogenase [Selenomonadaceae bacterium]|nr:nucleotide sugar dehydrogenase [Selenomonadaceae bacterium]